MMVGVMIIGGMLEAFARKDTWQTTADAYLQFLHALLLLSADCPLQDREREQMHQAMQQQRQEFMDRQRAAAANRRRAEDELGAGQQVPAAAGAAVGEVAVHVAAARQRRPRPAWDSGVDDGAADAACEDERICQQPPGRRVSRPASAEQQQQQPVGGRRAAAAGGDELSAEQRWVVLRAAAAGTSVCMQLAAGLASTAGSLKELAELDGVIRGSE
jgi:hypothetical protein